jgi:hypothetical protein
VFIQVIQGRTSRQDEMRELDKRWLRELAPGAKGWLGSTAGFTDDGMLLEVVRFESREAARANSARPEQTAFAEEVGKLFDGPLEFHDCDDVTVMLDGGSDQAGFVQVIQGRVGDAGALKALMADSDMLHEARPEIIGGTLALEEDGSFTETVAFSDEASARRGEREAETPEDVRATLDAAMRDARFFDLRQPWFQSPS